MSVWRLGAALVALIVALPVFGIATSLFKDQAALWQHLAATQLPDIVSNTLVLLGIVGCGTTLIGAASAWLAATSLPSCR